MPTIAKGNTLELYFDHTDDFVITPGSGGFVRFDCSTPNSASARPTARKVYSATTINIPGGSTVFAEAVSADATYSAFAGVDGGVVRRATAIGLVGDSIFYHGIRPGNFVSESPAIAGIEVLYANLDAGASTGTLEFRYADRMVRFTANGDTAGPWTSVSRSCRKWVSSGTSSKKVELAIRADAFVASDVTSALTFNSPNPPAVYLNWGNVPFWVETFGKGSVRFVNACNPGSSLRHLSDGIDDLFDRADTEGVTLTDVTIQCATNEFASTETPVLATQTALLTAAIAKIQARGARVQVMSVPMRNLTAASVQQSGWRAYNKALPALCKALGADFLDIWDHMIDPASAIQPRTGATYWTAGAEDRVHPSGWSAFIAGKKWFDARFSGNLSGQYDFMVSAVDSYNASTNPTGNMLPGYPTGTSGLNGIPWAINTAYTLGQARTNGGNLYVCTTAGTSAGAGGPSGTGTGIADNTAVWDYVGTFAVATSWDCRQNAGAICPLATKVSATDGGDQWQRITMTRATAITDEAKYEYNLGTGVTTVAAGDEIEVLVEINAPGDAGLRQLGIYLTEVGSSRNDQVIFENNDIDATYSALPAVAWSGVIRLPRMKLVNTLTSLRLRMFMRTAIPTVATDPTRIDVRRILWRKVS